MNYPRATLFAVLVGLAMSSAPIIAPISVARADAPTPASEAGKHFQRGVTLYNEADYHAALVEFRRAYEIVPNPAVLYNIGQTYYQLQNYAAALVALGRYLTEAGPAAGHRREVEQTIDTLQTRVGKVAITANVPGCDITVDDELIGKTPIEEPVVVSIGRRKVTALREGRPVETRFIDVAAGDTVKLALSINENARPLANPGGTTPPKPGGMSAITKGWYVTGGLAAVAIGAGAAAYFQSQSLKTARETFPAKQSDLDSKGAWVTRLSLVADVAGIAALVVGGITLKYSLSQSSDHEAHVAIAPNGIQIAGKF
jgi:tetratricopeptide (TPR) repeat protein